MIDLNNDLTLVLVGYEQIFYPRRWVRLSFTLYPTFGTTVATIADSYRSWSPQWHEDNTGQGSTVNALQDKTTSQIRTIILQQWQAYQSNPGSVDPQIAEVFAYVSSVGIKG